MSTNEQSSTQISANAKKKGVEKESGIGGGGASWSTLEAEGEIEVNRDEEDSGMSTSDDDSPLANKLVLDDKLKKRFAILYLQRTHGTVSFRTDFIRRYKDHECERCASLSLECVTLDWERHIPCDECGKTRLPCSKMHLFKRELLMKRMGINEKTFDALYKEYQENLKGKEGAVGSRGKPDRIEEMERDELVSSDVERGKAEQTSGNKKRKTEDEEASKKKRPKTSLSRNQRGENETEPNAPRNTVVDTASVSENRRNDREENGGEDDNGLENVVETPIRQKATISHQKGSVRE
ncbi:hypothetical protein L218DRAFT_716763 [Marasmius fiardii PR-910]|nr:hypothetical protein L218DRAFT_716763 [Marasmius fiardii PR-910]